MFLCKTEEGTLTVGRLVGLIAALVDIKIPFLTLIAWLRVTRQGNAGPRHSSSAKHAVRVDRKEIELPTELTEVLAKDPIFVESKLVGGRSISRLYNRGVSCTKDPNGCCPYEFYNFL